MGDKTVKLVFCHNDEFNFTTRFDILVGNQHHKSLLLVSSNHQQVWSGDLGH